MKKINYILILLFVLGCSSTEKLYYAAPSVLPHTDRMMKTPGFWISRHPDPDKIILSSEEIKHFNARVASELKLTKDITTLANFSGRELLTSLQNSLNDFSWKELFLRDGRRVKAEFFSQIKTNMNFAAIPFNIKPQYGFIVHYAHQRFFPTDEELMEKRLDIDFDEIQNSALDVGTPVRILHKSRDGKWVYVESASSDGWVKVNEVALGSLSQVKHFLKDEPFVIVVRPKADIFLDEKRTQYYDSGQMGAQFPVLSKNDGVMAISLPTRREDGILIFKTGYLKLSEVHQGYLPYTPRTMIEQAFELLSAPYGWGGMYGEQDCSRYLQEIFSTVGINLPRNSSAQGKVGQLIAQLDKRPTEQKRDVLKKTAIGGITILQLKGHILLFLGMVDERPFAIHAAWAYRQKGFTHDMVRVINRVVVSDLYLGEGSRKGSLLDRLVIVRMIK